ncbi:MAG: molybdopterin-guanine dinucleotide biosynthesis protein B, partial [bacterium]|nr:molybdopterin-guanine dinucleotide biosynthesis protein B [bacterium]
GANNLLEFVNGRMGHLVREDVIPGVLGKRRALKEYSGDIPTGLQAGDIPELICDSGLLGKISGIERGWRRPVQIKVIGALVEEGNPLNIKNHSIDWSKALSISAPIVAVGASCMNIGKTTVVCKVIKHFQKKGMKVAAVKLTGVAYDGDLLKFKDSGADPVLSFLDAGLPSTCGNPDDVIQAGLGVLKEVNKKHPDLIVIEFGDGVLGEYNVECLLRHRDIQKYIKAIIISACDIAAAWGGNEIMKQYGAAISLITGPAVNNETGVSFIEKHLNISAESNLGGMPRTMQLLEKNIISSAIVGHGSA